MDSWYDEAVQQAAKAAAMVDIHAVPGKKQERALVEAFRDGLALGGRFSEFVFEQRCDLRNWTSSPGGIDLVAYLDASQRLDFEMKVDKPDEVIWDAIKLAEIQVGGRCHGIAGAYLVLWATERSWAKGEAAPLFEASRTWGVQEMIEQWPKAWNKLREGGRGKVPRSSVAAIGLEPVGGPAIAASATYGGASIQVARVWPATLERLDFDSEGWPVAMGIPNFATPMTAIVSDEPREPTGTPDPCHGYLWLHRWSQARLEEVVPTLDAEARACLRSRLNAERAWSEDELSERFDPIPSAMTMGPT